MRQDSSGLRRYLTTSNVSLQFVVISAESEAAEKHSHSRIQRMVDRHGGVGRETIRRIEDLLFDVLAMDVEARGLVICSERSAVGRLA